MALPLRYVPQDEEYHHARIKRLQDEYVEVREDFFKDDVYNRWCEGKPWLLTCHGGPRSGKTSFAARVARRLRDEGKTVISLFLGHGSHSSDHVALLKSTKAPAFIVVDGLECAQDKGAIIEELERLALPTMLIQSRIEVEQQDDCEFCQGVILLYQDCEECARRVCQDCEPCEHDSEIKAMHINLTGLDAYIEDRVAEKDIQRKIKAQAGQSFLNARLLVDQWLRYKDRAMFDTQDHIRKCEIEFYDSLLHGMSEAGLISLAIVAADRPIRFEELSDAVHVLTGETLTMSELLHQTSHLIDISWEQVPEIKVLHPTIMAYLREEADLPIIDMTELCQYGIEHDGPFRNYALRNWSSFGTTEEQLACFDHYLDRFDEFRENTFLALNDDTRVKFYGTTVDHLKAWHGLKVSSNEPDQLGNLPIHIAAARGHAELVEELPDGLDRRRRSAFEVALDANKIDVCKVLPMELGLAIERRPEFAEQYMAEASEKDIMDDMHALHTAIRLGKNDLVKMFPKRDRKAEVLLLQNSPELLENIDDDLLKYANETTIDFLQSEGREEQVEILSTPLHTADLEESSSLLKYANELDGDGRTSLWNAIDEGGDRFDLLLEHTDVDHVDNTGDTVLVYACDSGQEDLALKILQKTKRPSSDSLAKLLKYAIEKDEPDSVLLLLSKGAHLWEYAKLGKLPSETALLRRASEEMVELVEELEQRLIKGHKIDDICSREFA